MHQRLKEAEEATCDRALVDLKGLRHLKWLDQRNTLRQQHKVSTSPRASSAVSASDQTCPPAQSAVYGTCGLFVTVHRKSQVTVLRLVKTGRRNLMRLGISCVLITEQVCPDTFQKPAGLGGSTRGLTRILTCVRGRRRDRRGCRRSCPTAFDSTCWYGILLSPDVVQTVLDWLSPVLCFTHSIGPRIGIGPLISIGPGIVSVSGLVSS